MNLAIKGIVLAASVLEAREDDCVVTLSDKEGSISDIVGLAIEEQCQ